MKNENTKTAAEMTWDALAEEINRMHRSGESVDQIKKELGVSFSVILEACGYTDELEGMGT